MKPETFIVILGLDDQKKPHAARFDIVLEELVRKGATSGGSYEADSDDDDDEDDEDEDEDDDGNDD